MNESPEEVQLVGHEYSESLVAQKGQQSLVLQSLESETERLKSTSLLALPSSRVRFLWRDVLLFSLQTVSTASESRKNIQIYNYYKNYLTDTIKLFNLFKSQKLLGVFLLCMNSPNNAYEFLIFIEVEIGSHGCETYIPM